MNSNSLSKRDITYSNNMKQQLFLFAIFGVLATLLIPGTSFAESETLSDFEQELEDLDRQYQLLHEEYGLYILN